MTPAQKLTARKELNALTKELKPVLDAGWVLAEDFDWNNHIGRHVQCLHHSSGALICGHVETPDDCTSDYWVSDDFHEPVASVLRAVRLWSKTPSEVQLIKLRRHSELKQRLEPKGLGGKT